MQGLREFGIVEPHADLIARLAHSKHCTKVLTLPGQALQTSRAQSAPRARRQAFLA